MTGSARPAWRELGARAADVAARGGMALGPAAQRMAAATDVFGAWVAIRGRQLATDLRGDRAEPGADPLADDLLDPYGGHGSGAGDGAMPPRPDRPWAADARSSAAPPAPWVEPDREVR